MGKEKCIKIIMYSNSICFVRDSHGCADSFLQLWETSVLPAAAEADCLHLNSILRDM